MAYSLNQRGAKPASAWTIVFSHYQGQPLKCPLTVRRMAYVLITTHMLSRLQEYAPLSIKSYQHWRYRDRFQGITEQVSDTAVETAGALAAKLRHLR